MENLDMLNDRQREAVLQTEGPVLILAGAGSGKTRVLTQRIAYLIEEKKVNPWNILAITFTNKAAGEMRERVDAIVGFGAESIWVSTFHSMCVRILRRYIDRLGFDTNFTIYDTDDSKSVMKEICKRLNIDTKIYKERALLAEISSAKDELVSPEEYSLNTMGDFSKRRMAEAYREYQDTLKKNNALDFDDLIVKTVELFRMNPDVLDSYQERFRYISVDEYQDTNTAQFELVRLLSQKYRNLCVVGDDDQSIYKFRGANIRNILDFEKVFPEAAVVKLEQNYRSTQTILDAANAVIRNNTARKDKRLWTDQKEGEKVHFRRFETAYEEAEFIASDIVQKKKRYGAQYRDFAVLYRTNAQSRLLEERFILEGIPYDVVGGVNFYARKEIKDVLAYLKTIENGRDDLAVKRIINVPRRGIGATTILRVQDYADGRGISFFDALCEADQIMAVGKSASKIKPFVTMIRAFRSKMEYYGLEELVQDVLDTTGYGKELEESDEEDAQDRLQNIDEFISKVVAYETGHDEPTLSGFLEEVALVADVDNVDGADNRALLMTLHAAKGLEFPFVYLSGMEDGIFPGYMTISSDDPSAMEEERRLAYVGITRAKEELTLTCARQRMVRGETQYNPVSRFVREVPQELLDEKLPMFRKMPELEEFQENPQIRERFRSAPYGGNYGTAPVSDFRPKAVAKPRRTAEENKPFIARGLDSLSGVNGLNRGGQGKAAALEYAQGDRVSHMKYGEGTVLQIEDSPRDYRVTVDFDRAGTKIMYAAFAKLKKL
ncbi:MAG TPA: DNA helicase PcrA [Candidatus Eisenbergiella stercorigallinarum]|uniref:ATP-dependent DNA helicase n=1 Tax=Candidatus Eisenbergiella stercorigallinarum TaxID=2838557 RepID=A0A9D2QX70_9FIRM|nr:DNA helicase PcrA [Candidatus Eisenbergiella stercorigallinarum]